MSDDGSIYDARTNIGDDDEKNDGSNLLTRTKVYDDETESEEWFFLGIGNFFLSFS